MSGSKGTYVVIDMRRNHHQKPGSKGMYMIIDLSGELSDPKL